MVKKPLKPESVEFPSKIRKIFRRILKTLLFLSGLWTVVMVTLLVITPNLCTVDGNCSVTILERSIVTFLNIRAFVFLDILALFIITIIGAIAKLVRKRTILIPILCLMCTALTAAVVDYATRDRARAAVSDDSVCSGFIL